MLTSDLSCTSLVSAGHWCRQHCMNPGLDSRWFVFKAFMDFLHIFLWVCRSWVSTVWQLEQLALLHHLHCVQPLLGLLQMSSWSRWTVVWLGSPARSHWAAEPWRRLALWHWSSYNATPSNGRVEGKLLIHLSVQSYRIAMYACVAVANVV